MNQTKETKRMKLKYQIAAGAALLILAAGCSQDQTMGGGKDTSTTAYTNEAQEPAKAPATPSPAATEQPTDKQLAPAPTNPPQATPPANNAPGDHP